MMSTLFVKNIKEYVKLRKAVMLASIKTRNEKHKKDSSGGAYNNFDVKYAC